MWIFRHRHPYHFDGYGWEELLECWGLEGVEAAGLSTIRAHIKSVLDQARNTRNIGALASCAKDVRGFLQALRSQEVGFRGPVWNGLLKIRDDYTLLQFVSELLPLMWT